VAAAGIGQQRHEPSVELIVELTEHSLQKRLDRREVIRRPSQRDARFTRHCSMGDGVQPTGDEDPTRGVDDRLTTGRAAGATTIHNRIDSGFDLFVES
jgi:hypothetical protein